MSQQYEPLALTPEIKNLLDALLERVRHILSNEFVGFYLEGSLANGGFDAASDIDFVAATRSEVTPRAFQALRAMHDDLSRLPTPWAIQLEGSYLSVQALRRHNPTLALHPNLQRGEGERLEMVLHDAGWDIHRHVLRERGIRLAGPLPHTLIDPVTPDQLRQAMQPVLSGWAASILRKPASIQARGYQSYTVLSICRILYTREMGEVASKMDAASWAVQRLPARWSPLIRRALANRMNPEGAADPNDIQETLALIRDVLEQASGGQAG